MNTGRRMFVVGVIPFFAALAGCFRENITSPGSLEDGVKPSDDQLNMADKSSSNDFIAPGSVAAFMMALGVPGFDPRTQFIDPPDAGVILLNAWQDGDEDWGTDHYNYHVNGERSLLPINLQPFNIRRDRLTVIRLSDGKDKDYGPYRSIRTDIRMQEVLPDDGRR